MHTTFERDPLDVTVAAWATQVPGATEVFRRHRLDFCCGGQRSLREACAARDVDPDAVLAELQQLPRTPMQAPPSTTPELIEHILRRYHDVHRQQLPELIRLTDKVEAVHRNHPDVPVGLGNLLRQMHEELLEHMSKEENVLFPMLRAGGSAMAHMPIKVMRMEHDAHGEQLQRLRALTRDMTPPDEACATWRALYTSLSQFVDDLMQHIHLENNVLFPPFERT
ncbi:MAG: iron-sulfur cluster repair protein YtfE [Tepidimonas ignava]|uniref:iron-sulfur cluster repair protein YtfE n=1 Tax=Tepidimonas ignava TaxID=114249 RepID=UPI0039187A54